LEQIKHIILLSAFYLFCYTGLNGQTGTITGSISNENKSLSNLSVSLLKAADSNVIKQGMIDSSRSFQFRDVAAGKYIIAVTGIGWKPFFSSAFTITGNMTYTLPPFTLAQRNDNSLAAVTVTAVKSLFEKRPGQMTINVETAPTNAGSNVMEILVKSPGISVDRNGTISLNGKRGVIVMLDGKPAYLNGQELETYLSGLSSQTIEKIEIMTTPPAKYDAAGGAGVINIITKKLTQKGFNGAITANYSQGVYARYSIAPGLNYFNGKINYFFNGSSEYITEFLRIPGPQYFYDQNGKPATLVDGTTCSRTNNTSPAFNVKTGMDYYLSNKTTIGVVLSANNNNTEKNGNSLLTVDDFISLRDSLIKQKNYFTRKFTFAAVNLNFSQKLNDKGEYLTVDLDYLRYSPKQTLLFNTQTFNADKLLDSVLDQKGALPFRVDIYSTKIDYSHILRNNIGLNAGGKSSYVTNDNVASYFILDPIDSKWTPNPLMSRKFIYNENINAAYVMLKKSHGNVEVQGGLRAEHTYYQGKLERTADAIPPDKDSSFTSSYLSLFPSMSISYSINKKNTFSFNYARKIDRPNYYDLNPFIYYITPYTTLSGNPGLKPQYTNTLELYYSYRSLLSTTVSYSNTKNAFESINYLTGQNLVIKPGNIGQVQSYGLSINFRKSITGWWTTNLFLQTNYNKIKGIVTDQRIYVNNMQFSGNLSNMFQFPGGWSGEVAGFYKSRFRYLQGTQLHLWSVNAAVSKKLLKERVTLKAGITDIFYSQVMSGIDYLPRSTSYYSFYKDSRRATLSITFSFGKKIDMSGKTNNANKTVSEADRVK
jgi:outer membrane receptor protein involved in Fe transport